MAEMVLFPLINRLIFLLTQEANLLRGIHEEVADIKDELIFLINTSHGHGSPVREETSPYFSPSLVESIFLSPMLSHSDSESPLFFPDNKSPKFSHSNSIGLLFPSARSETTDSSQNDEEIIQNPSVPSFSDLFPPSGTTSDSETASSICDYGPTTLSISLLFPANKSETENENDIEAEPETSSLSFIGTTPNLSHYMMQRYLSHSIMQFFPPARSPSQTDSSENYEIIPTDSHGYVCNGTPPAPAPAPAPIPKFSYSNSIKLFSPPAKTWVKQVREVAFHIDVAIDQYLLHMAQHDPHPHGFTGFVHKAAHYLKTLKPRHKIACEIQKIKASILKIKERTERYHFKSIDHGLSSCAPNVRWHNPQKASLYLDDTDIVGIEFHRDNLTSWLVKGLPHCIMLSILGMGGLGKTTLAKKVYNHQTVRGHFDCQAWISVSQSYNIEDLLRSMIKQFCEVKMKSPLPGMDSMDEESLILSLRNYLQQKRYVVVFDDIRKIDFWEDIKHVLPNNNKASRIIITTRMCEVVNFCKKSCPVYVHQLQPLPPEKAWELFCKRAFRNDFGGHCPLELEELSQEIVEKCQGLQLAITSIGGLLSTKHKTLSEWRNLHDNLAYESRTNPHLVGVHKVLSLSYEDLPYHLKSCLLYFGMYPENFRISCRTLIRQWIAEGFVNEIKDKTLEEIGQEYLTELIDKSLVQVLEVNVGGEVIVCGIHDLLHEIILQKMEDLGFCHVLSKGESSYDETTRRMSIHRVSYGVLQSFKKSPIHSLLFFNIDELPESFMSSFLKNFKLMKVLDFENTPLDHLPEDVGNLFHLKYLNLNGTKVKTLPKSIVKLQNLETLSLEQTLIQEVPFAINKLHKLRCLLAYYFDDNMDSSLNILRGVKIHGSIGCLKALGNLRYMDANLGGVKLVEDLRKLSQLKDLGLVNLTRETGKALCTSIENMNSLTDLYVSLINEDEVVDLQLISSPPKCLRKLSMKGRLAKLPDWISELQHLVSINFYWTRLSDDPLKAFQKLPNLAELILEMEAYNGEQLQIRKGGFPKLKVLGLADLTELISLNIYQEALPLLAKLSIERCPQLMEVPSGVQHLRNLSELIFTDMPSEFEQSLDPKQGSHYWIIEHVPFIFLRHKVRKGSFGNETHKLSSKYLERSKGTTINQADDTNNNNGDDINASDDKGKQIIST